MTTITSATSGLASATGTWVGGVVPVEGDKVIVAHTATGASTFSTDAAGYAIGASAITLTGAVVAGSFVVNESVTFAGQPTYYKVTAWNSGTKLLTVTPALVAAIPAAATVVTSRGHVVTLDGTHVWGDDSVTTTINNAAVNVLGTLYADRAASSSLTGKGLILTNWNSALDYGRAADPITGTSIVADLLLNKAVTPAKRVGLQQVAPTTSGQIIDWSFVGDSSRLREVDLASDSGTDTGITLSTASHGWVVGDELCFFPTTNNTANDEGEERTIDAIAGADITLNSALTYNHKAGSPVGNLTCNARIRSYNQVDNQVATINNNFPNGVATSAELRYVFDNCSITDIGRSSTEGSLALWNSPNGRNYSLTVDGCVFRYTIATTALPAMFANNSYSNECIVRNTIGWKMGRLQYGLSALSAQDSYFYLNNSFNRYGGGNLKFYRNWISMFNANETVFGMYGEFHDCTLSGRATAVANQIAPPKFYDCDLGYTYGWSPLFSGQLLRMTGGNYEFGSAYLKDCLLDASLETPDTTTNMLNQSPLGLKITYENKGGLQTAQEIYYPAGNVFRENSTIKRSASSISIKPLIAGYDITREQEILCSNGASITVVGYVNANTAFYNGGGASWTAPTVVLSGLGEAAQTFTASAAANNAWEMYQLTITNNSGADGNFTLTYTANAKSVVTGTVYFDGVPDAPFVTKCRHYGYTYDEANPVRTLNKAVTVTATDPDAPTTTELTNSEAAALLLGDTELTITAATSAIVFNASRTFQQLYDYTQAWACTTANLGYAVPLTGAGVAGNAALFAVGNITTTGYTLDGGGTLNIPSGKTLTASLPFVYTYTGGTFSQVTTVPTFSGGTLNIGAADTYTYTQAAAMILSMTPTAPGTYTLGAATFTGEVDLRNAAAHAITVELPTGTSYTTASNTGGTITVSLPVVTANISITSMPDAGAVPTRLQIINSTATGASAWAANTVYATGAIVKRTTGLGSESTAGLYFRATTGGTSHATTEPTWDTTVGNTTADNTVVWTCYAILYYDDDPAATSLTDTYIDGEEFLDGESVEVRFAEMDGSTSFKTYSTTAVVNSAGFSVLVSEDADDVYATNALDGSDYEATFSPNFTLDYMVLDTNTDFSGKAAFAYYCYTLTTSAGMWGFWGGVTALDEGNYRVNTAILNLHFDESAGFVKQTDNVRIFRDDGLRPAIDPTTGGHGIEINWRTPVNVVTTGGSALTAPESAQLMALPSAADILSAAATTPIHADVRKVVGITVDGTGTDGDPWGPQ